VQEVIVAAVEAQRARRLRDPAAVVGYLRTTARFKFVDRLRRRPTETLEAEQAAEGGALHWPPPDAPAREGFQIWDRVRELPEKQRAALLLVYVEGRTYEEAAERSGIPLGSLKRYLREGLAALREKLSDFVPAGPIGGSRATLEGEGESGAGRSGGGP
jgi:RNA polymerase sigma-70 factor (ECF subfamily)